MIIMENYEELKKDSKLLKKIIENARNKYNTIEIEEAKELIEKQNPIIIDVRNNEIYKQAHLPNAINISILEISESKNLPENIDTSIITVCNRGNASLMGLIILNSLGYKNVKSMNGGTLGWIQKGLKIEHL